MTPFATLVETGVVGLSVYLVYFAYTVLSALAMRRSNVEWAARLGAGMTAAIAGTAAANFFYLTMSFYYFYVFAGLAIVGYTAVSLGEPLLGGGSPSAETLARTTPAWAPWHVVAADHKPRRDAEVAWPKSPASATASRRRSRSRRGSARCGRPRAGSAQKRAFGWGR